MLGEERDAESFVERGVEIAYDTRPAPERRVGDASLLRPNAQNPGGGEPSDAQPSPIRGHAARCRVVISCPLRAG